MIKTDKIFDRLNSIDKTLAGQHETLKEHIRRTEILEHRVEPLERSSNMLEGAMKFIALTGILATMAEAIHMFFK